jgi:hypothetical protein
MSSDSIALAPSSHDIVMATLESSSAPQPSAASQLYNNLPVSGHCLRLLLVHACEGPLANDAPLQCSLGFTDLRPKSSRHSHVIGKPRNEHCFYTSHQITNLLLVPVILF